MLGRSSGRKGRSLPRTPNGAEDMLAAFAVMGDRALTEYSADPDQFGVQCGNPALAYETALKYNLLMPFVRKRHLGCTFLRWA